MSNIEIKKDRKKISNFKDLDCWREAHSLVLEIYKITSKFPTSEIFALTNQLRRASVSISSNIAEGFGRQGYKEKLQFFYMSRGSLIEIENQLLIAKDLKYIDQKEYGFMEIKVSKTHQLINGIIRSTKTYIKND